ncbi:MAG: AAA family ATPase, partial [Spongiibacter sp.]
NKAKFELLDMDGVLSFEYDTENFANVGGLSRLRDWLGKREQAFQSSAKDSPKGIMLVGVQGGGKSLAAKAVAGLWGLPLLRMDMGAMFNKFFGESERNVRDALKLAETMSPCVLWIDEIEKGIVADDNDGGTARRVLGTLLTWMAEQRKPVFMVATANDIQRLPPELIRKGRLDEIFFVDLPSQAVREDIFRIHLAKREHEANSFDLPALAQAAEGFTGAEIEQAVVSAGYTARAREESLSSAHIIGEVGNTVPLSITMSEQLAALRHWCQSRAVAAD